MFHRHSSVDAIETHLRAIESELAQMGKNAGRQAGDGAARIGEQIGNAAIGVLNEFGDRYRNGRRVAGEEAQRLGNEAVRVGTRIGRNAVDRLSTGVERRPLTTLAVAIGVGILIGIAGRRH